MQSRDHRLAGSYRECQQFGNIGKLLLDSGPTSRGLSGDSTVEKEDTENGPDGRQQDECRR
jgi:hypothetical protein